MGRYCLVPSCKFQAGKHGISVHTANGGEQARQWLAACKSNGQVNVNNSGVCSLHFGPHNYNIHFKFELVKIQSKVRRRTKTKLTGG